MGMSNIQCAGCGAEKPPEAYPKRSGRQTRRGVCRACLRSRKRLRALGNEHADPPAAQALDGEQAAASEAGAYDAAAADTVGEQQKRKRKKKRRRGKRAKKKAGLEARIDEAADTQLTAVMEAVLTEQEKNSGEFVDAERNNLETAAMEPFSEDEASEQDSSVKRKRKRGRRRRGKKKGKVIVSSKTDGEEGYEDHSPELQATHEDSSEQLSSAESSTDSERQAAERSEEEAPVKRKRKRKRRRRKGKRNVEGEASIPEAAVPKRPAVRPPNKRIIPFKGPFTFDAAILNDKGTGMIRLRGRRETGKRWHTEIEKDIAVRMVQEGAAGIIHPRLIHKLYTKSDFRLLILQRDNYVCRYCGQFGDTIDHVMPKSKGGLSSPMNCVCACSDCNLLKADKLDFPYPDDPDE
jgi:Restriction endonuclease